ncbi:MAG: hypothetical protein JKY52_07755 [Flavobacteriales bacterium]|nr:hypothetical protein [Flavobacteriales bacterium]
MIILRLSAAKQIKFALYSHTAKHFIIFHLIFDIYHFNNQGDHLAPTCRQADEVRPAQPHKKNTFFIFHLIFNIYHSKNHGDHLAPTCRQADKVRPEQPHKKNTFIIFHMIFDIYHFKNQGDHLTPTCRHADEVGSVKPHKKALYHFSFDIRNLSFQEPGPPSQKQLRKIGHLRPRNWT